MRLESWSQLLVVVVVVMVGAYATIFYPIHMLNYAKKRLIPATFFFILRGNTPTGYEHSCFQSPAFFKKENKIGKYEYELPLQLQHNEPKHDEDLEIFRIRFKCVSSTIELFYKGCCQEHMG